MAESHVLESLTQSKHLPERWYAKFTGGETLKVNVALVADFSLFSGRELDDEEFTELRGRASAMNARARAMRILGARQMSRRELIDRLVEKGESEEDAEDAADYLDSLGILDDGEYAGSIVRHYSSRGYGMGRIKSELRRRGVPREYWDAALLELPEDTEAIDALIARKLRGAEPDERELKRLTDMLLRRGFGWEEIRSALKRYGGTEVSFDE